MKSILSFSAGPRPRAGLCSLCLLACLAWLVPAGAVEVRDLYEASVPVSSRTDAGERSEAIATAMREVLVKVTGKTATLDDARVRQALRDPDPYVASFGYRSVPAPEPARAAAGEAGQPARRESIELEVSFYEPEVLRLLNGSGIAVWPQNRPATLVWLVVQDELGERQVMDSASGQEVVDQLRRQAEGRGLPLLFPLMDLQDRRQISADALWRLDVQAVREASSRYQAESVLVARLFRSLSGENLGRSVYLFRGRTQGEDLYADSLRDFLAMPVSLVARELSGYYGILLSGTDNRVNVKMTVEGIASARAYAGLVQYISELSDVQDYSIVRVRDDVIDLELATGGQIRQLVESIALENKLVPVNELTRAGSEVFMQYRWNTSPGR